MTFYALVGLGAALETLGLRLLCIPSRDTKYSKSVFTLHRLWKVRMYLCEVEEITRPALHPVSSCSEK